MVTITGTIIICSHVLKWFYNLYITVIYVLNNTNFFDIIVMVSGSYRFVQKKKMNRDILGTERCERGRFVRCKPFQK